MPFLRFKRDRRGYEVTCVVHTFRQNGKSRSKILYWFRTPPDIKVGRAPLDEEATQIMEAANPRLSFDWTKMLKLQAAAVAKAANLNVTRTRVAKSGQSRRGKKSSTEIGERTRRIKGQVTEHLSGSEVEDGREEQEINRQLCSDDLERFRAVYAELLSKITEKISDPVECADLRLKARDLDPDSWCTETGVQQGLINFRQGVAELWAELSRRRRAER